MRSMRHCLGEWIDDSSLSNIGKTFVFLGPWCEDTELLRALGDSTFDGDRCDPVTPERQRSTVHSCSEKRAGPCADVDREG